MQRPRLKRLREARSRSVAARLDLASRGRFRRPYRGRRLLDELAVGGSGVEGRASSVVALARAPARVPEPSQSTSPESSSARELAPPPPPAIVAGGTSSAVQHGRRNGMVGSPNLGGRRPGHDPLYVAGIFGVAGSARSRRDAMASPGHAVDRTRARARARSPHSRSRSRAVARTLSPARSQACLARSRAQAS